MKIISKCLLPLVIWVMITSTDTSHAEKEKAIQEKVPNFLSSVLDISEENTYPNSSHDRETPKPNKLTKNLIKDADVQIDNPKLIKMLNETDLRPSPLAIGYRGMIYMGNWPLSYKTKGQTINWQYQKINSNKKYNKDGIESKHVHYVQEKERQVRGGLTEKVNHSDQIKTMMLLEAQKHADLPLSFRTVIGEGTETNLSYGVPRKKTGILDTYAPAVHEKGEVKFGEVYLKLKGSNKEIVIKNVTERKVGAWIPIQDRISVTYRAQ